MTADVGNQIAKYRKFVFPHIHLTCAEHMFGIQELRAQVAIAFEEKMKI